MVLAQVLLRVLPQLVVVLAPDGVATDARDLLHTFIVRRITVYAEAFPRLAPAQLHAETTQSYILTAPSGPVGHRKRLAERFAK
jgi:hypothetical protein